MELLLTDESLLEATVALDLIIFLNEVSANLIRSLELPLEQHLAQPNA
ncbi:MAG: hypothetical protein JW891_04375 [Candidatus Lokiarchaeota archaeon]|nr:hypothetical protein [Candidatus Lokiarchaeota archaeon]